MIIRTEKKFSLSSVPLRRTVFSKSNGKCWYCGGSIVEGRKTKNDPARMRVDHVVPQSVGGSNDLDNLVSACHACNEAKNNHDRELLRYYLSWRVAGCRPLSNEQKTWLRANGIEPPVLPFYVFWYEREGMEAVG